MSSEQVLAPNYQKLDVALRAIGYSFEVAVADVIDNSVDAGAKNVLVRLIGRADGHIDLVIWDDGRGMTESTLKEAMRFGADVSQDLERLGKFGLGLKLASLSQARELSVVTSVHGRISGRAWLEHGIAHGFSSTVYDSAECDGIIRECIPDRQLKSSGTLVRWSRLYRVGKSQHGAEEHGQKLMHRLENYLALAFHRFLTGRARKVRMVIDMFDRQKGKAGIPVSLDGLDPFNYPVSGCKGFPSDLITDKKSEKSFAIRAHVWPANSTAPEYKLPGGSNARQGFYFYRNDRLIQGGGWNGLRETEPHASLARIEIDMDPKLDIEVSLDVKKVEIQLPPTLEEAIRKSRTSGGIDFKQYLALADKAYRKRAPTDAELPLIPSAGLPAPLTRYLHRELRIKATAKHKDLKFTWATLDDSLFFEIDRESGRLCLNKKHRKVLQHGLGASSADVPVLKCLLFFALDAALASERTGPKVRERLELVNRVLVEAVKFERLGQ